MSCPFSKNSSGGGCPYLSKPDSKNPPLELLKEGFNIDYISRYSDLLHFTDLAYPYH